MNCGRKLVKNNVTPSSCTAYDAYLTGVSGAESFSRATDTTRRGVRVIAIATGANYPVGTSASNVGRVSTGRSRHVEIVWSKKPPLVKAIHRPSGDSGSRKEFRSPSLSRVAAR
jgi:hypothetical protein